jgi:hypothetical protein
MGIVEDAKDVIYNTFGEFSAKKVEYFAEQMDYKKNHREFIDKCKNFMAGMLGEKFAMQKFKKLYDKYC